jgi:hypothetical protein
MNRGELLTRITIWTALTGYALGAAYLIYQRGRRWEFLARLVWTASCLCLLAHAAFAFHYYHGWSQATAYAETARQTAEVFGINWGGGLFINYALMLAWITDVVWWWGWSDAYRRRPRLLTVIWHGFMIFIFFNATVVFGAGLLRWIGAGLCLGLGLLLWFSGAHKAPLNPEYLPNSSSTE